MKYIISLCLMLSTIAYAKEGTYYGIANKHFATTDLKMADGSQWHTSQNNFSGVLLVFNSPDPKHKVSFKDEPFPLCTIRSIILASGLPVFYNNCENGWKLKIEYNGNGFIDISRVQDDQTLTHLLFIDESGF